VNGKRVIGVDLGGTKILSGLVDEEGAVIRTHEVPTPTTSEEELVTALETAVEELLSDDVAGVGFGVPSTIDQRAGRVLGSVNIPLQDFDLRDGMRERFGLPVSLENDANAATHTEWPLGAGRGTRDMVMLTLGTGVGGGVVIDGRLYRGWAEFGHIVVQAGGPRCQGNCTGHGHLEAVASGSAGDREAQRLWGGDAGAEQLVERAQAGDGDAVEAVARMGRLLGAGIGSLVNIFNPQLVVVGGGFGMGAGHLLLEPALAAAKEEALFPADQHLRIVEAQLGSDAGLVGAALLALEA
jgi:glucokinase